MKIQVRPIFGAEPLMCSVNVAKRIKACGGSAAYGWLIRPDHFCDIHISHVVWRDDNGELWDVTPEFTSINGEVATYEYPKETEFVPDDAAVFTDNALPSRYVPHVGANRHVIKACECMTIADKFLKDADIAKCKYWTDRANAELRRAGISGKWDSPTSDMMSDVLPTMLPAQAQRE